MRGIDNLTHERPSDAQKPYSSSTFILWKRVFDVTFAVAALLFLIPVLVVIISSLLIADGRPILFRQERIGRDGRPFKCLKFRSMVKDADSKLADLLTQSPAARRQWEEAHKLRNDPRIHGIGGLLRKSSLDELPQFINVIKGDMSIVGPRPIVEPEVPRYGAKYRHYITMRPGITGLWQVSGRNSLSYPERVALDAEYVTKASPILDLKIVLKTAVIVFAGRGDH